MKTTSLKKCLHDHGISPSSFAYFLSEFQKKKGKGKSKISKLLTGVLKAQAELMEYHLTH